MSKIFRPRRGKSTVMASETKAATVLAQGEMFVEVPSTGVGTGESNIKLGDGTTTYGSLPYAMGSAAPTSLVSDASTTATTALNNVTSGKSLKNILGSLKRAISLNSTSITLLNDTISSLKSDRVILSTTNTSTDSIMFGKDSSNNYGYIIPGADTVTPFSSSVGTYKVTLTSTLADISTISATIVSDGVTYTGSASGNNTSPGSHKIAVGDVTFILSAWYSGTNFTAENTGKFIISNPKGTFELIAFKTPTGKFVIGDN